MIDYTKKIYVAGHNGMVGSAIVRELKSQGFKNLIIKSKTELNLINQADVQKFFKKHKIDEVYLAAAKVGGIYANNNFPADFIYQNLMIQSNVINSAFETGVKKLLFLGSSCIYPVKKTQPMREDALLTGKLEPTNEPYAISKIAGIKLCESYNRQYSSTHSIDYRSVMPTNLYGPGDNYHKKNSHVIPALLRRFHEAKSQNLPNVKIWGTGEPRREFLHVDDLANGAVHIMNLNKNILYENITSLQSHINIGYGEDIRIADLVIDISKIVGYEGKVIFDISKPDGPKQKLMDSSLINNLGWSPRIRLIKGLKSTYKEFIKNKEKYCNRDLNEK